MNVLAIGNSFAEDTFWLTPEIALSMGMEDITFAQLNYGGCSLRHHLKLAQADAASYQYWKSDGGAWRETPDCRMRTALEDEVWDWIVLSTGTGDGSRWTEADSYAELPLLIDFVRQYVPAKTRIAFNVTWAGETYNDHPDLVKYNKDQVAMLDAVNGIILTDVATHPEIATIIPTGVAVQNLRGLYGGDLSRDGYHLSYELGRYTTGVTAMMVLTGCTDVHRVTRRLEDAVLNAQVFEAVSNALKTPYTVMKTAE